VNGKVAKDNPTVVPVAVSNGRRYELVVGGEVKASISSFAMTVPGAKRKFDRAVQKALRERQIDATVERLYPDEPLHGAEALTRDEPLHGAEALTRDEDKDS